MIEKIKSYFREHKRALPITAGVLCALLITVTAVMLLKPPVSDKPVISGSVIEEEEEANDTGRPSDEPQSEIPAPQDDGSDNSENPSPKTENISVKGVKITAEFTPINSWEEGGKICTQVDGVVKNTGETSCLSWNISYTLPKNSELRDSWNGVYKMNGSTLHISNESYNGNIPAGGFEKFGFIVKSPTALSSGKSDGTGTAGGDNDNNNNNNGGDNNNNNGSIPDGPPPSEYKPSTLMGKQGDDWLTAKGNKLYDKDGKEVWLTGVNWFGYNTGTNTFDGLWACELENSLQAIADRGFNLLRIPMSAELVKNWQNGSYPQANYNRATNEKLNSMNSLEIFEYTLEICRNVGIKVMIDIHSAKTDAMGHMYNVWYNGNITTEDYYAALEWLAYRYRNDDTIIAYDLKNEPHGKPNESPRAIWNNSTSADNWKYVAQTAALKVLNKNPNVLIVVEGIEIYPKDAKKNGDYGSKDDADYHYCWWGGNLRGVKDFPLDLGKYQDKLVYSPHDYGPSVYRQPWFYEGYNYDSLMKDCWRDNWFYIYENKTAPLLIGEWGGFMNEPNLTWMTHMRTLIKTYKLHHTFWCFNANSGDTGGLVKDDFVTWDEQKYAFVKEALWQKGGKFVGLDHEVPLGNNGIALGDY